MGALDHRTRAHRAPTRAGLRVCALRPMLTDSRGVINHMGRQLPIVIMHHTRNAPNWAGAREQSVARLAVDDLISPRKLRRKSGNRRCVLCSARQPAARSFRYNERSHVWQLTDALLLISSLRPTSGIRDLSSRRDRTSPKSARSMPPSATHHRRYIRELKSADRPFAPLTA